jgi:amino-acid N-acetyltransferase
MRMIVNNAQVELRSAGPADAPRLHALIAANRDEGRLLPRTLEDLGAHATRFVVAVNRGTIVGCAELAPLSPSVAEVRSLAVDSSARGSGLGQRIVDELGRRARRDGFTRLCAFAHAPAFFVRLGFSIVPHTWVPEKIAHDCGACDLFRGCGQFALTLDLHGTITGSRPAAPTRLVARARRSGPSPISAVEGPRVQ